VSKTTIALGKFRDLPSNELTETLAQLRDELFRLRLGMQTNQVSSTAQVGAKRRDIARIMTILNARAAGAEQQADAKAAKPAAAKAAKAKAAPKAKKSTKAKAE
jgi:large subunit ribosomal protein L29